jgi:DNA-3-methyladenine glycosylase II
MYTYTMQVMNDIVAQQALDHLSDVDPVLAPIIMAVGLCTIRPHGDYYKELVESIIGQQLSVKAAAAIRARFWTLFDGIFPTPTLLLSTDPNTLRSIGFSYAKAKYVHDIARRIDDGSLRFETIDNLSNEEVVAQLTEIKGVGEWTAHMFLMFCMARTDILPVGDVGIRNGIRALYNYSELPTPTQIAELATKNNWHPFESVASWYVWHSLDNSQKL